MEVPVCIALLALAALPAVAQAQCPRGTLTGEVTYVRDGDTIELGAMAIRLDGLAAPEWNEPGGDEALAAMRELVLGKTLRCELDGQSTYDRCAGICYLDGADIAAEMVRLGLARDCPRYSGGRYEGAEAQAAAAGATIGQIYELPGYCEE